MDAGPNPGLVDGEDLSNVQGDAEAFKMEDDDDDDEAEAAEEEVLSTGGL